jgi:predicted transcriptional regulator YdeE
MQKTIAHLPQMKCVGITTRTNSDPSTNTIAATVQTYFHNGLSEKIMARKNPGTTFCVYTNYESDFRGLYTFFIGEEVNAFEELEEGFETLIIPAQNYAKFTNQPGPMPAVCIDMWKRIWEMDAATLGGERAYIADFEVYDKRALDHQNVVLDIYIGTH